MNGYVINVSGMWTHAFKQSVRPGHKISLNELYKNYGVKYNIEPGIEFVNWLKEVKLRDTSKWRVVFNDEGTDVSSDVKEFEEPVDTINVNSHTVGNKDSLPPPSKMEVSDIVGLSVRLAREVLPKVKDRQLLKYSLNEARQLSGKDTLCILLRKRIEDLELSSSI